MPFEMDYSVSNKTNFNKRGKNMEMNISANKDTFGGNYANTKDKMKSNPQTQLTETDHARSRFYKLIALCLGIMCVLLLTAITVMWVKFTAERHQIHTRYNSLAVEKYQLEKERDALEKFLSELRMQNYFNNKLYCISSTKKTWKDSREDCKASGADLVIIDSKEEQEFLSKLFGKSEAWIGLTDAVQEGVFKWVDDTTLSTGFWWTSEPNDYNNEDCVITGYSRAKSNISTWADYPCNHPVFGICEKSIFRL